MIVHEKETGLFVEWRCSNCGPLGGGDEVEAPLVGTAYHTNAAGARCSGDITRSVTGPIEQRPPHTRATLKWTSFPSRQPGGQQVGRPISGVLVTHEPTGISVGVTSERSQYQNRKKALRLLEVCIASALLGAEIGPPK